MQLLNEHHVHGEGEVIALRTHFPHTSGKLSSYHSTITRAIVLLRNPMFAISNYFTQIYRVNNHLDHDSLREGMHVKYSMEAWIKWRERHLGVELELFTKFVLFWREFGDVDGGKRIYVSYMKI